MYPRKMWPDKKVEYKTYMLTHKLKWYQKILQKLHIKNYYKEIKPLKEVKIIEYPTHIGCDYKCIDSISVNEPRKEKYPIKKKKYFRKEGK